SNRTGDPISLAVLCTLRPCNPAAEGSPSGSRDRLASRALRAPPRREDHSIAKPGGPLLVLDNSSRVPLGSQARLQVSPAKSRGTLQNPALSTPSRRQPDDRGSCGVPRVGITRLSPCPAIDSDELLCKRSNSASQGGSPADFDIPSAGGAGIS